MDPDLECAGIAKKRKPEIINKTPLEVEDASIVHFEKDNESRANSRMRGKRELFLTLSLRIEAPWSKEKRLKNHED